MPSFGPGFSLDPERGIWLSAAPDRSFVYSDGEDVESAILATMTQASDRRVGSEELESSIHDFVTRYHLSANRSNLLRPLRKLLTGRVLEVGAGCGALTRYLGETAASVVALEGSPRRATICRARCSDLPNVHVVCADAMREMPRGRYDAVILVGVLEYAGRSLGSTDPYLDLLRRCRSALTPSGILVLAIENRLGLKYFAGAPEDHIGVPFAGLHDAYDDGGPRTFGRLELQELLGRAGLPEQRLLFPFPDYKFPRVVVSETALDSKRPEVADLLAGLAADDQAQPYGRSLSEEAAWPAMIRNGVGKDLANSFLIVAGRGQARSPAFGSAYCYSLSWRRCFQKETVLRQAQGGEIAVHRARLYPAEATPEGPYTQELDTGPFVAGALWGRRIYDIVNKPGWTVEQIAAWAKPWVEYLVKHSSAADSGREADRLVDPSLLDCTPFNLVKTKSGRLIPFDQEWVADDPQPLGYIVFRGLLTSLLRVRSTAIPATPVGPTIGGAIGAIAAALDVHMDEAALLAFAEAEARLQTFVSGGEPQDPRKLLGLPVPPQRGLARTAPTPEAPSPSSEPELKLLREQVDVLQGSVSARDAELARLRGELVTADEATQALGQRINAYGRQIVQLQAEVYSAGPLATQLDREAREARAELVEANESLRALQARARELEQRNVEYERQRADDSARLAQIATERDERIAALERERLAVAEAAALLAHERGAATGLTARNEELRLELEQSSRDLLEVRRAFDSEHRQLAELSSQAEALRARLEEPHASVAERDELALQVGRLALRIDQDAAEIERYSLESAANLKARAALQESLAEAQTKCALLEDLVREREDRYLEISTSLVQLTNTNNDLVDAHAAQQELAASLESQLAEKQALLVQVSDWATSLKAHADQLTGELTAVTRSHSWRVTRPLRELGIVLRNPLRIFRRAPGMPLRGMGLRRIARKLLAPIRGGGRATGSSRPRPQSLPALKRSAGPELQHPEDIFMWGVIDWHFRIQRPQQLAKELARRGHNVYYVSSQFVDSDDVGFAVEPIPVPDSDRHVSIVRLKVPKAPLIYFAAATPDIQAHILADVAQLLSSTQSGRPINIVQHPYWLPITERMPNQRLVYDCMDNHGGFGNNSSDILVLETLLTRRADLVVVTSAWIERAAQALNPHVAIVHNGCEPEHFAERPERVYQDRQHRQIIGYYGAIAEWFDADLVLKLAAEFPSALILLVGADTANVGALTKQIPNIVMTGEVPYSDLPFYLHAFDVCILPFKINELTLATNPVKAYEYLSAGKPVVSVDLPELSCFDGLVARATQPDDFVHQVRDALRSPGNHRVRQARMRFGAAHSWRARAETLEAAVHSTEFPMISIVIVTYNNRELTAACFESITELSDYPRYEVIVVDNASTDGSPETIAEYCRARSHWQCILNQTNRGFAAANNQGLAAATGDYLVLLNNDTVVTRGWLGTLAGHLKRDEDIGLIGPVSNNIGNEARIETDYKEIPEMHEEARAWTLAHIGETREIRTLAFFCVMMPRRVFERVGPLDEAFGIGMFEDDDYCRRIEREGWRIVCAEDVFIHHRLSASLDLLGAERRAKLFQVNRGIYESKWGKWVPHVYRD